MRSRPSETIRWKTTGRIFKVLLIVLTIAAVAPPAAAQKAKVNFTDVSGKEYTGASESLDVPYVPTSMKVVRTLLELGSVGPNDFLIDLGSGDGRIVITAAKEYGARGLGVDLNKDLVALSRKHAAAEGVGENVDFFVRDIFKTDLRQASVVSMYLLNDINIQMRPKLLADLKPGTRIVSHDFHMGDWRPDKMVQLDMKKYYREDTSLYLWVVPAKVAGRWQWLLSLPSGNQSIELELDQSFQDINGSVERREKKIPVFDAELSGDRIRFSLFSEVGDRIVRQDYQGRVAGDTIVGTVNLEGAVQKTQMEWRAARTSEP